MTEQPPLPFDPPSAAPGPTPEPPAPILPAASRPPWWVRWL